MGLYNCVESISDIKTCYITTLHSKSTIAHSLRMVSLTAARSRRNSLTITSTDFLCVIVYSNSLTNHRFAVGLGQSFGKDWIHIVSDEHNTTPQPSWWYTGQVNYSEMMLRTPEYARRMNKVRSGAERYGQVCIMQTRLPRSAKTLQISSVMWKSSRMRGVKLEVFHDPGFGDISGEWTAFDVDVGFFSLHVSLALISLFI